MNKDFAFGFFFSPATDALRSTFLSLVAVLGKILFLK